MTLDIPVTVDSSSVKPVPSMNVGPILHEVRHALQRLIDTGESTTIDLRAMPLAPGEGEQIRERLGRGEVEIRIDALGPSTLTETAYPGVWWVEHRNNTDTVTGLYIEIASIPSIVPPGDGDMREGLAQMTDNLNENE